MASRVWDSLLVMKSGCAGGRGFAPGRGNSKESFSSNQETGMVFSPEMPFYSKFKKILKYVVPVGKCSYRPSASPSYEASSHVNNYAYSGKLLLYDKLVS